VPDTKTPQETAGPAGSGSAGQVEKKPRYDWDDPGVPAGDGPPMPWWPVYCAAAAWGGWLVFLIAMAIFRVHTSPF